MPLARCATTRTSLPLFKSSCHAHCHPCVCQQLGVVIQGRSVHKARIDMAPGSLSLIRQRLETYPLSTECSIPTTKSTKMLLEKLNHKQLSFASNIFVHGGEDMFSQTSTSVVLERHTYSLEATPLVPMKCLHTSQELLVVGPLGQHHGDVTYVKNLSCENIANSC